MNTLGKVLIGLLDSLGFLTLLGVIASVVLIFTLAPGQSKPEAPDAMVLTLSLDGGYVESSSGNFLAELQGKGDVCLLDALIAIERAKTDDRVKGLYATVSSGGMGFAQAQDLRNAITSFRESGKPAVVFSETMGEGGSGTGAYYLASAFEDIWLQPSGQIELFGLAAEILFFADFLGDLGIEVEALTRKEYKSALESFTSSSMSEANREAMSALLDSVYSQIASGIAEQRALSQGAVDRLFEQAPILAAEAVEAGLVDQLGYRDEVIADLDARAETDTRVGISQYLSYGPPTEMPEPEKTVAMITGVGPITRGDGDDNPFAGEEGIKSGIMAKAIRDAVADESVDAILLRVDSPGGRPA